jgi:ABC-type transporter Mla subunit MlaD
MEETNSRDSIEKGGKAPDELTAALEATLDGLNGTIEKMEEILRRLAAGKEDWEENVRLLGEANAMAVASSRQLDEVVQDVVYGAADDGRPEEDGPEGQA